MATTVFSNNNRKQHKILYSGLNCSLKLQKSGQEARTVFINIPKELEKCILHSLEVSSATINPDNLILSITLKNSSRNLLNLKSEPIKGITAFQRNPQVITINIENTGDKYAMVIQE